MSQVTVSARTYLLIGVWLAALMLAGVLLSELHILPVPRAGIVLLVLGLSTIKALLVAGYYMHLKIDRRLLAVVAIAPFALILLALSVVFSSFFIRL